MDALSVLRVLTRNPILLAVLALFCAWPVIDGLYVMMTQHRWMLMDIDAVLCGAKTLADGHSPYAIHPHACGGNRPAAYVYAPQVARVFIPFINALGVQGARQLFIWALLAPATLFLLWFAVAKRFPRIDIRYRLLAFAALTPMTFVCANVGIVMHAIVLASLLFFQGMRWPKTRWPFTIVVLICGCIKPTFLAYFVIFMLDDQVLWKRAFSFLWRAVLGCVVAYLMVLTDGTYGRAWQRTLHSVTMARQVGMGWFELTDFVFHVPGPSHLNVELALGFMIVMLLAAMAIAQWADLEPDERLALGMGLVPLMTPRLLDYDMILTVSYAALLMSVVHRIGGKVLTVILSWIYVAWLAWGVITNITGDASWHRTPFAMLLFGLLTGVTGLIALGYRLSGGFTGKTENRSGHLPTPS